MAHEITSTDRMVWAGMKPWHGLGEQLPGLVTAEDARQRAIPWHVELRPVLYAGTNNDTGAPCAYAVPDQFVTVRDDNQTPLGVVGSRYTPIQHEEIVALVDALAQGAECVETCASLRGGSKVFAAVRLNGVPGAPDKVDRFLVVASSHDGSSPLTALVTPIRVVCSNTLTAAIQGTSNRIRIRHTASAPDRTEEAARILKASDQYLTAAAAQWTEMARTRITDRQFAEFLAALVPAPVATRDGKPSTRALNAWKAETEAIDHLYRNGTGADPGTAWGAWQAATAYASHVETAPGEDRMLSLLDPRGNVSELLDLSFTLARDLVAA